MSAMMDVGYCTRCGRQALVGPLYLDKGGPLFCIPCGTEFHAEIAKKRKQDKRVFDALMGGLRRAQADELCLELLEDAIRLTHPDRHPPERQKMAERVTTELLLLKPFVHPRPAPSNESALVPPRNIPASVTPSDASERLHAATISEPSQADRNGSKVTHGDTVFKPSRPAYPCDTCRHTIPMFYCDACRERNDAERKARQEKEREQRKRYQQRARERREWRKPKLTCPTCGTQFKGRRKDVKFCSPKCRQKAHRDRQREGRVESRAAA